MGDDIRTSGLGGGDLPAIMGLDPYGRTPYSVWEEKTGRRVVEPTAAMRRGLMLEPYVRDLYRAETGLATSGPVYLRDAASPWKHGHLDDLATPQGLAAPDRVTDYKTLRPELARFWGEAGTEDVPLHVKIQVTWYMPLARVDLADIAAAFGFDDFRVYSVPFDPDAYEMLHEAGYKFWHNHVLADIPPPLTAKDAPRVFTRDTGASVIADEDVYRRVVRLSELKAQAKVIGDLIEQYEGEVKLFMQSASVLTDGDGNPLTTWKTGKAPERIDVDRLRAEEPELAKRFTKAGAPARRFIVKV